ncbi:glycosyltransferase family 2 protein [Alkalicoccus urumqiensis]|uniref:Glycosyltransferase family 2 protein n=1 Tax=Alkalicoccus urumqiensis TaxID=1548213 RepID=A0A2P6MHS2_ALKUR|nr:glycosyltransferase family 2 protein [Alkalicoccus urumqiensis]PRO65842.1 glycosyltransferase family 2 protein [Alkalicoccus urumqiensis]
MQVSVVIPTYNRSNTLTRAINSVLKQTYPVKEIIIVDDNSSDNTSEVIETFKDPRIRYLVNKENQGGAFSRNRGIVASEGDVIAFQDSDDEWVKEKLELQMPFIDKGTADVVCSSYNQIIQKKSNKIPQFDVKEDEDFYTKLLWGNFIGTPTIVAKKNVLISEMFDESLPRFQDWELMIRISHKYKIAFINSPLVDAYLQNNSLTRNDLNGIKALEIIMLKQNQFFIENNELKSHYYRMMALLSFDSKKNQKKYFSQAYMLNNKNLKLTIDFLLSQFNLFRLIEIIHKYKRR